MQRFLRERCAESHPLTRIVVTERESATHKRDRADAIPQTCDVQQRRDIANAVSGSLYELRRRTRQSQLRRRHLSGAQLVFQSVDLDMAWPPVLVSCFDVEERESASAARIALRTRQCECYLRTDRRRKPLP